MNELLQARIKLATDWYNAQSENDRRMLKILAIFLLVAIPLFAFQSLYSWNQGAKQAYQSASADAAWVLEKGALVAGSNNSAPVFSGDLMALNSSLSGQYGVRAKRADLLDDSKLKLSYDAVPFDKLIVLLQQFVTKGVKLSSVEISRDSEVGKVDANVVLTL